MTLLISPYDSLHILVDSFLIVVSSDSFECPSDLGMSYRGVLVDFLDELFL